MTMEIAFSHDYEKLPLNWEDTQAVLLEIKTIDLANFDPNLRNFISWDTKVRGQNIHYKLTQELNIILFMVHIDTGQVFTTIRRYTSEKWGYYSEKRGQVFTLRKLREATMR